MPASECCGFVLGADEAFRVRIKCMYLEELSSFWPLALDAWRWQARLQPVDLTRSEPRCGTSPAPAPLLSQLGLAQCSSVSPSLQAGPLSSAPLLWHCRDRRGLPSGHSCHLSGGRELLLLGLMAELGCLGLEWMRTRAVFQVCVSGFCYRFR